MDIEQIKKGTELSELDTEIIELTGETPPVPIELLKYNCLEFKKSIEAIPPPYPKAFVDIISNMNNLSLIDIKCHDEDKTPKKDNEIENGKSIGYIYNGDYVIATITFTSTKTRYCFEIFSDSVSFNDTHYVCYNKIKDKELENMRKKPDFEQLMYKRTYSPVLEALNTTLIKISKMRASLVTSKNIWDYLFQPFFQDLKIEEYPEKLREPLQDLAKFNLSYLHETKDVIRDMLNEKGYIYWLSFKNFTEIKILLRILNANDDFLKISISIGETYFELFIPKMFNLNDEEEEFLKTYIPNKEKLTDTEKKEKKETFYLQTNYMVLIGNFFAKFIDQKMENPVMAEKKGYKLDFDSVLKNMPKNFGKYFQVSYSDFSLLFTSFAYMLTNMTYGDNNLKLYDIYFGNINEEDRKTFLQNFEVEGQVDFETFEKLFETLFYSERTESLESSEIEKDSEDESTEKLNEEPQFKNARIKTEYSRFFNDLVKSDEHEKWIYVLDKESKKKYFELEGILDNKKIFIQDFLEDTDLKIQNNFLHKLYFYLRTKSDTKGANKFSLVFGNREINRFMIFEAWGYEMTHIKVFHINLFSLYFNTQFIIQNSSFSFDFQRLFELITMTSNHYKDIVLKMENIDGVTFDFDTEKIKNAIDELIKNKPDICYYDLKDPDAVNPEEGDAEKNVLTYFITKSHIKEESNCNITEENISRDYKLAIVVQKKQMKNEKAGFKIKVYDNKIKDDSKNKDDIKNVLSTEYEFYRHNPYNFKPIFKNYMVGIIEHFTTGAFD